MPSLLNLPRRAKPNPGYCTFLRIESSKSPAALNRFLCMHRNLLASRYCLSQWRILGCSSPSRLDCDRQSILATQTEMRRLNHQPVTVQQNVDWRGRTASLVAISSERCRNGSRENHVRAQSTSVHNSYVKDVCVHNVHRKLSTQPRVSADAH